MNIWMNESINIWPDEGWGYPWSIPWRLRSSAYGQQYRHSNANTSHHGTATAGTRMRFSQLAVSEPLPNGIMTSPSQSHKNVSHIWMQILLSAIFVLVSKNYGVMHVAINKLTHHAFRYVILANSGFGQGAQKSRATQFRYVVPNICGSSEWFMLLAALQAPTIFKWLLAFYKICTPLALNAAARPKRITSILVNQYCLTGAGIAYWYGHSLQWGGLGVRTPM